MGKGGVTCNGKSDERETNSINSEWAFSLCTFRKNEEISDHFIPVRGYQDTCKVPRIALYIPTLKAFKVNIQHSIKTFKCFQASSFTFFI